MTFLRVLTLSNNRLADLHSALCELSYLRHLERLDLAGNPLSEEKDYRLHVIKELPWLKIFDRHVITEQERHHAAKLKPLVTDITMALTAGANSEVPTGEPVRTRSPRTQRAVLTKALTTDTTGTDMSAEGKIEEFMRSLKRIVKGQRLLLKAHFMDTDRRREDAVTDRCFRESLSLYGIWPSK